MINGWMRSATLMTTLVVAAACGANLDELVGKDDESETKTEVKGPEASKIGDTDCADALVQETYPERYIFQDCPIVAEGTQVVLPMPAEPNMTTISVSVDGVALMAAEFTATYDAAAKTITIVSAKFAGAKLVDVSVTGSGAVSPPGDGYEYGFLSIQDDASPSLIHAANRSLPVDIDLDVASLAGQYVAFKEGPNPCANGNWLLCDYEPQAAEVVAAPTDRQDAAKCDTARGGFASQWDKLSNASLSCDVDEDCALAPTQANDTCPDAIPYSKTVYAAALLVERLLGANAEIYVFCPTATAICDKAIPSKATCDGATKTCVAAGF